MIEVDKTAMYNDFLNAFIQYQWRLDNPYPAPSETKDMMILKYRSDPIFNNKVRSMASGAMQIVGKYI